MRTIKTALVFSLVLLAVTLSAQDVRAGRISGKMMIRGAGPMAGGTVMFFSSKTGPPPLVDRYFRVPVNITGIDEEGKFSAELPAGEYYMGGIKQTSEKWGGPPREGDLFFIIMDEKNSPKTYTVNENDHIDIGMVSEAVPYKMTVDVKGITAIEGVVHDPDGKPVEDVLVFAYLTPAMDTGPAFVSGYSESDGRFILRVHEGGRYYLMVMGEFRTSSSASGMKVSDDGKAAPAGLTVKTGEIKKKVDIKLKRLR